MKKRKFSRIWLHFLVLGGALAVVVYTFWVSLKNGEAQMQSRPSAAATMR